MIFSLFIILMILMMPVAAGLAIYIASPALFQRYRVLIISAVAITILAILLAALLFGFAPMVI